MNCHKIFSFWQLYCNILAVFNFNNFIFNIQYPVHYSFYSKYSPICCELLYLLSGEHDLRFLQNSLVIVIIVVIVIIATVVVIIAAVFVTIAIAATVVAFTLTTVRLPFFSSFSLSFFLSLTCSFDSERNFTSNLVISIFGFFDFSIYDFYL